VLRRDIEEVLPPVEGQRDARRVVPARDDVDELGEPLAGRREPRELAVERGGVRPALVATKFRVNDRKAERAPG
jgi:hypothetical protein